jgi:hypothetical protein
MNMHQYATGMWRNAPLSGKLVARNARMGLRMPSPMALWNTCQVFRVAIDQDVVMKSGSPGELVGLAGDKISKTANVFLALCFFLFLVVVIIFVFLIDF